MFLLTADQDFKTSVSRCFQKNQIWSSQLINTKSTKKQLNSFQPQSSEKLMNVFQFH